MMITLQQMIAVVIACLFVGIVVGMFIWFHCGIPKCEHKWEKIIDDKSAAGPRHVVVHICSKCGKRKTTKVNM